MIHAAIRFTGWLFVFAISALFLWTCLLFAYLGRPL